MAPFLYFHYPLPIRRLACLVRIRHPVGDCTGWRSVRDVDTVGTDTVVLARSAQGLLTKGDRHGQGRGSPTRASLGAAWLP
jgi:hypothetical protein